MEKKHFIWIMVFFASLIIIPLLARSAAYLTTKPAERAIPTLVTTAKKVTGTLKPDIPTKSEITPIDEERAKIIAQLKTNIKIVNGRIIGGFKNGHAFSVKEEFEFPLKQKPSNKKEKSE